MKNLTIPLALALHLAATALPAADCGTTLQVESRTEYYFSESDLLSQVVLNPVLLPIPVELGLGVAAYEILTGGTNCAQLNFAGLTLTGHATPENTYSFDIATFLPWAGGAAAQFATDGVSVNGVRQLLQPTIAPCQPRLVRSFAHVGGSMNVLAIHAGSDAYPRKLTKGTFHLCRDLVVQNNSGTPVEIPMSVSGEITVYGSFSIDTRNYAKARLSLRGAIGGQAVALEGQLNETQLDPEPYVRTLNETRRVTIPSSPQPQTIRIDLQGEAECEAQAKGGGMIGFVTASSAATANFPNSIDIGLPTGPGGGPLPPGVRVYDASDGSVYVDTTANPVPVVPVPPRTNNAPFAITHHFLDPNGLLHLVYPANTNDYYLLYWGDSVASITNPFALALGVDGPGEFVVDLAAEAGGAQSPSPLNGLRAQPRRETSSSLAGVRGENGDALPIAQAPSLDDRPHLTLPSPLPPGAERESLNPQLSTLNHFFRLREVPLAHPLDVDGDGFDDLTEYRNPALDPFVPNTPATNAPPAGDTNSTSGEIFLWTANNHRYLPVAVTNGITWPEADAAARAAGGHLATLASAPENAFVFSLIDRSEYWMAAGGPPPCCNVGPWLGGVQTDGAPEPAGGWTWVTAEPFDYAAWNPGEPDNNTAPTNSNRLQYFTTPASPRRANWNDAPESYRAPGYVIEFEPDSSGGDCIPRNGLVAWWKGDGNALDCTGTNDASLANGTSFGTGVNGQAFSFDGVDDYIDVGPLAALDETGELSVSAWVFKTAELGQSIGGIVGKWDVWPNTDNMFLLWNGDGANTDLVGFVVEFSDLTGGVVYGTQRRPKGVWMHVVGTWRNSDGRVALYVNGQLESEVLGRGIGKVLNRVNTYTAKIGAWGILWASQNRWQGQIDDVLIYNRALTAEEIAGIYSGGITGRCQPQCVPPPPGLVAWWPLDGNGNDLVGGNNGTLHGGISSTAGTVGGAFNFDGVDDYIAIPNSPSLNPRDAISVEAWYKPPSFAPGAGANATIVDKAFASHSPPYYQYHLGVTGDRYEPPPGNYANFIFSVATPAGGGWVITPRGFWTPGNWYHLVGTYNGSVVRLFVNGAIVAQTPATGPMIDFGTPLYIGRNVNFAQHTPGDIDEVSIYSRALSADEIAALYFAGSAGKCPPSDCAEPPTGLVAWWPAEGNANDVVGNHHGTLQNGATFAPGLAGQAFSLDGADDYVQMPANDQPVLTNALTVQAWVNVQSWRTDGNFAPVIVSKYDSSQMLASWVLWLHTDGRLEFLVTQDGELPHRGVISTSPIPTNQWTHVAGTYRVDTQEMALYVNGQPVATTFRADSTNLTRILPSNVPIRIGARVNVEGVLDASLHGMVDEVLLFNRALSAAEIQARYQSVAAPPAGPVVDHGGADWTVTLGEVLAGAHVNIGEFVVPSGVTAQVAPFDGAGGGSVEIRARTIRVAGTLDATGKGYPGGGGGGGGGGGDQLNGGRPGNGGLGGAGHLLSSPGLPGTDGFARRGGTGGWGGGAFGFTDGRPSFPGLGRGGAPGGENAGHNPVGTNGLPGGYFAPGANGDTTVGDEVHPGFGGGGGGGGGGGHSRDVNSGGGGVGVVAPAASAAAPSSSAPRNASK